MLTEAEAKTKWCPYMGGNTSPIKQEITCVASGCMAWRVIHKEVQREDHSGAWDMMNTEALRTHRHVRREGPPGSYGILILDAVGYCGLAGAPSP